MIAVLNSLLKTALLLRRLCIGASHLVPGSCGLPELLFMLAMVIAGGLCYIMYVRYGYTKNEKMCNEYDSASSVEAKEEHFSEKYHIGGEMSARKHGIGPQ